MSSSNKGMAVWRAEYEVVQYATIYVELKAEDEYEAFEKACDLDLSKEGFSWGCDPMFHCQEVIEVVSEESGDGVPPRSFTNYG